MEEIWTKKWKHVFIWICSYFSLIAYAIVGGYVIVKSDDQELKKTAKTAFIVTLIFMALSSFLSLYNSFGSFSDSYYGSGAYDFYTIFNNIVNIARIVVYAVFIVLIFVKNKNESVAISDSNHHTEEKNDELKND